MTMKTDILDEVLSASSISDLKQAVGKKPKRAYLIYARLVHPDLFLTEEDKKRANEAFVHLGRLRDLTEKKSSSVSSNRIKTKKHEYTIDTAPVNIDDVLTTFKATYDDGHVNCFVGVTQRPEDGDLTFGSAESLRKLRGVPEEFRKFYPELVESFRYRDPSGIDRPVIVTNRLDGFRPLRDVLEVYPEGIGGRDVAWIFRRMLVSLGVSHDHGLIHGAPTIDAFQIHDQDHGLILGNWQYSVPDAEPLKAVPGKWKHLYPEASLQGDPVGYKLDLEIAAKTAKMLLREDSPRQLQSFFKGCTLSSTPQAKDLLREFDTLLLRIYGKPRFSKFTLDNN